jgi:hypothetical protein
MDAGILYLPYCRIKICPPLSCERESEYAAHVVKSPLYKLWGEGEYPLNPEATSPRRVVIRQVTKPATPAHIGQ